MSTDTIGLHLHNLENTHIPSNQGGVIDIDSKQFNLKQINNDYFLLHKKGNKSFAL